MAYISLMVPTTTLPKTRAWSLGGLFSPIPESTYNSGSTGTPKGVELEDVEAHLRKADIVETCAVVHVMRGASVVMLAAYVTLSSPSSSKLTSIRHIKRELANLVQAYMVPQKTVILDVLPKNNSGKIDRAKLKEEAALA